MADQSYDYTNDLRQLRRLCVCLNLGLTGVGAVLILLNYLPLLPSMVGNSLLPGILLGSLGWVWLCYDLLAWYGSWRIRLPLEYELAQATALDGPGFRRSLRRNYVAILLGGLLLLLWQVGEGTAWGFVSLIAGLLCFGFGVALAIHNFNLGLELLLRSAEAEGSDEPSDP